MGIYAVFLLAGETGSVDSSSPLTWKVCLHFIDKSATNENNLRTVIGHVEIRLGQGFIQFLTMRLEVTDNVWDNGRLCFFQFSVALVWVISR